MNKYTKAAIGFLWVWLWVFLGVEVLPDKEIYGIMSYYSGAFGVLVCGLSYME